MSPWEERTCKSSRQASSCFAAATCACEAGHALLFTAESVKREDDRSEELIGTWRKADARYCTLPARTRRISPMALPTSAWQHTSQRRHGVKQELKRASMEFPTCTSEANQALLPVSAPVKHDDA